MKHGFDIQDGDPLPDNINNNITTTEAGEKTENKTAPAEIPDINATPTPPLRSRGSTCPPITPRSERGEFSDEPPPPLPTKRSRRISSEQS